MLRRTRLKSRGIRWRWLAPVAASAVALAVLPLVTVQPALATNSTGVSTATFTGSLQVQLYELCDQATESVSWSMTATATDDQLGNESVQPLYWHYTKLSGKDTLTYTGAAGCPSPAPSNCSSAIHEWPDYETTPSDLVRMAAVLNDEGGFDYFLHVGSPANRYAFGDSCVYTTEPADEDLSAEQGPLLADVDTSPPGVYTRDPSVSTDSRDGQGYGIVTSGSAHLVFQAGTGTEAPSPATTHKAKQAQQDAKAAAQARVDSSRMRA
jgi:hypothetical protein